MGWRKRGAGGEESYTLVYKTKKAPQVSNNQTKRTEEINLGRNRFFKQSLPSKQTFFWKADAKCLFSSFWIEMSEHMLSFNKSWHNHNRQTQTCVGFW